MKAVAAAQIRSQNTNATQKELANLLGVSARTIKRRTIELQKKGRLKREGGKRHGNWKVLPEDGRD